MMNKILYLEIPWDRSDIDWISSSTDKKRHSKISKYFWLQIIDNLDQWIDVLKSKEIDAIITNYYWLRALETLANQDIIAWKSIILVSCLAKNWALDKIENVEFEKIYRNNRTAEKHIKEIRWKLNILKTAIAS